MAIEMETAAAAGAAPESPAGLRVLHVIPSLSPRTGGPAHTIVGLCRALRARGVDASIATTTVLLDQDVPGARAVDWHGVPAYFFRHQTEQHFTFSWPLTRWLAAHVRRFDVVHIHTLFSYATTPASYYARKHGVPYIIRPLGTLGTYSLRKSALKKALYLALIERRNIAGAAALHFTSEMEKVQAEAAGFRTPGIVVPIGVEALPEPSPAEVKEFRHRHGLGNKTVALTVSRLDPKKGFDLALRAMAGLGRDRANLRYVIAGDGEAAYSRQLLALTKELGIEQRVLFTGQADTRLKAVLMRIADVFLLASYHENFAVSVAEALYAGVPVCITDQVGVASDVQAAGAGVVTTCELASVTGGLRSLLDDRAARQSAGAAGAIMARRLYRWETIAAQIEGLYRRLARKAPPR